MYKLLLMIILFQTMVYGGDKMFPSYIKLEVISVHDGDTIKANVHLPANVTLSNEYVRFNYDAWEIGARTGTNVTDEEKKLGEKAKKDLLDIFSEADIIYGEFFAKNARDSFGRLLIRPTVLKKNGSIVDVEVYMKNLNNLRK